jgi:predicted N-acyltransferase
MTFSKIFKKLYRAFEFCQAGKDESFKVHFFDRMNKVHGAFINLLENQPNIFLRSSYLSSLEDSKPADMDFAYACVEKDGTAVAFLYFQLLTVRFDHAEEFLNPKYFGKELAALIKGKNNIFVKKLFTSPVYIMFCGNVFVSGEHGIYLNPKTHYLSLSNALPELIEEIIERAGEAGKIAGVVIKDFYEGKPPVMQGMEKEGYLKFYFEPDMVMQLNPEWQSFDDYLDDLSSKYRIRAKNVLRKGEELIVKNLNEKEIRSSADVINTLYKNVHQKSAVHFSEVDATYFACLKNKLKNKFCFRAFYLANHMVAFSTMVYGSDYAEAHLIGLDYTFNKSHSLYPFILYDYIEEAIAARISVIHFGRTALEIKSTVGAKPVPMYCYVGLQKPLSVKMISPFFNSSNEKDFIVRDPFKESRDEMVA